jgi:hypothetical protein
MVEILNTDHDILVALHTDMVGVKSDLKELKDNTAKRVDSLETEKLNIAQAKEWKEAADKVHESHETRLRRLEWWGAIAIGALYAINFYFQFIHRK